ncbi:conserved hypothetcial protein [Sporisorium reilianum SRZ2]|uniref:Conserved hypothetcial protein n=1 Tax=Sporisorium reilianum (strain SRZ2) TaxID=999809 RepID=E6ZWE5_SPORE|nr:conserved hypothetcial protein [Sporisorium reilianum SRZ2]
MPASSAASRPSLARSLPSITIFSHPAARLIKTVPQLQPPARTNAHVPIDTLGVGRTSPSDVVLTDVYGPLALLVVPDPLDPTIATLVISVDIQDVNLQGAARRFVLPFRSFQRDPVTGELVSRSKINGFDAADRIIYPGLGAGLKGLDGGSFWFFEDVGEQGALDRFRWEKHDVGRRAIWTVWLISTPAPVVLHVQHLLQSYPATVPPLPPWLKQRNGYPWQDSYLQQTISLATSTEASHPQDVPAFHQQPVNSLVSSFPSASQRPLPSIPSIPPKPQHLRGSTSQSSQPNSTTVQPNDITNEAPVADRSSPLDSPIASVDSVVERSSAHLHPALNLSVRSKHLRDGSSSVQIGDAPEVILRNPSGTAALPEYRNSLVAVDNLTGQIIGVLASHVDLDASPPSSSAALERADSGSSHDSADAEAEEQHEAQTPLDERASILQHKSNDHVLGLDSGPPAVLDDEDLPTPRASTIIHRAASVYHDQDAKRVSSRPPSVLAVATFSPPPLPPKSPAARHALETSIDAPPSRRTSTASAVFFTAESDADAMSSYDSDALEIDPHTITHHNLPARSTSIRARGATADVERHRPELLCDADAHDDAASDASGSTVGGPAMRLWRKARGKPKKKPAVPTNVALPRPAIKSRQASELSDRTSKAETALEAFSDDDDTVEESADKPKADSDVAQKAPTPVTLNAEPLPKPNTQPGHHLARAQLRTDEVRSIEDRIWREALESDQLPIDAPYTHLAARGEAGFYPSSILSSPRSVADSFAIELLSLEDKARQVQRDKWKQQQQNVRAERIKHMQGGTVLIEFLAGSSRIGASLIRSAGLDASGCQDEAPVAEPSPEGSSKAIDLASNVLGYVPLLPQHLLSFLGLSSSVGPSDTQNDAATQVQDAASSNSYLSNLRLPAIPDWMTSIFSFNPFAPTNPTPVDVQDVGDPSKAEEWEYVVPEFDPDSLSSTPRPVYRRKRPVPSVVNGFNISAPAPAAATTDQAGERVEGPDTVKPSSVTQPASANENRYSILHFDSYSVGRRAFLRGMPEVDGVCF